MWHAFIQKPSLQTYLSISLYNFKQLLYTALWSYQFILDKYFWLHGECGRLNIIFPNVKHPLPLENLILSCLSCFLSFFCHTLRETNSLWLSCIYTILILSEKARSIMITFLFSFLNSCQLVDKKLWPGESMRANI